MIPKKMKLFAAATLLLSGSYLSAANYYGNCCDQGYNDCCQDYNFGIWFDPMGVKPCQTPLSYADETFQSSDEDSCTSHHYLKPDFSFGFKVGAGFSPQCGRWSVRAEYTRWTNDVCGTTRVYGSGFTGTSLTPAIGENTIALTSASDYGQVSTELDYKYNLLDVTAGWTCCLCEGLGFTPYGGFRGFWYTTDVDEVNIDSTGAEYSATGDKSYASNDYKAYGVVGGMRFNFNLCGCFNFYGFFGGSLIGGDNDFKSTSVSTGTDEGVVCYHECNCLFVNTLEGGFGLSYDDCFCGVMTHLGIGYEVIQYNDVLPLPFDQVCDSSAASLGMGSKQCGACGTSSLSGGLFVQAIVGRIGVDF